MVGAAPGLYAVPAEDAIAGRALFGAGGAMVMPTALSLS